MANESTGDVKETVTPSSKRRVEPKKKRLDAKKERGRD